jgi:antitoxin component YwqK of YwqJK toxin-antitoxin module
MLTLFLAQRICAQGVTRYTYHDAERRHIKEAYQVKDTIRNVLQGKYFSYFLNGNIESKGQFTNNETSGVWEFFYENGKLKMRGILKQSSNDGLWEYYYENGNKSMEGTIYNKKRTGDWKVYYEGGELKEQGTYVDNKRQGLWISYFEDGTKKGEIEYKDDNGRFIEYYHSGKVYAEGPKSGVRQVGHWRYYDENGVLFSEGDFIEGRKSGVWTEYYKSGKVASLGNYENDAQTGEWKYFYEDGTISNIGQFTQGLKNGYWSANYPTGKLKSEATYNKGVGEYREYFASGKLKAKGLVRNGKNDGDWKYYFEDGKLEGECIFEMGKGIYKGYYPSGALQTKGLIEDDLRVGTWELYETDGRLSGYYKPVYDGDKKLTEEITEIVKETAQVQAPTTETQQNRSNSKKGFTYFDARSREYRGIILQGNPFFTLAGFFPMGIEFYNEERLGHEFGFESIRNPYYTSDAEVPMNQVYQRGYAISIKQKFYNPMNMGMWYFAHEVRFTNLSHFSNIELPQIPGRLVTVSATEQRAEYGILLGSRFMKNNRGDGFTLDGFLGYAIGYRIFDADPNFAYAFDSVDQSPFSHTFRFGFNIGYSLSFDGKR